MISCVTSENISLFGTAFSSQYKLRHKCFLERQSYKVWSYSGMEYDQYDNPSAAYLIYQSVAGKALGMSRMTPVSHRSMIRDLWPEMLIDKSILDDPNIWEATRFCIDKDIDANFRNIICKELVCSYLEFGLERKIKKIIGVMPTLILRTVFGRCGVDYQNLGPIKIIEGERIQAASMDITEQQYEKVKKATNINGRILSYNGNYRSKRAA